MARRKRSRGKTPTTRNNQKSRNSAKKQSSTAQIQQGTKSLRWSQWKSSTLPIVLLVLISFVAFANAWPNNLTYDDMIFSQDKRAFGLSLEEVGHYFTEDVWAANGGDSGLYRPLLLVSVAIDILLFGDWVAGYHLVNIFLHMLMTLVTFGFIRYLLVSNGNEFSQSSFAAFLAALIFAVHPIHAEVVNSVFNRSEMLASLGMVGGLWWFLQSVDLQPWKSWVLLGVIYLLVMLCRETGIMLPAIIVVFLWVLSPGDWKLRVRKCIPVFWLLIPLIFYFSIRAAALEPSLALDEIAMERPPARYGSEKGIPVLGLFFRTDTLLPAFAVWFDSIRLFLWPDPLLAFHSKSETNGWLALFSQSALLIFALIRLIRKKPGMFLGLALFYLAIFPSSLVIGQFASVPILAERFIYLPSVGLAIVLAFGFCWLLQRTSSRTTLIPVLIVLMALTPLTWARNAEWASSLTLSQSDYRKGQKIGKTLETLVSSLLKNGDLSKARTLCDRHADQYSEKWFLVVTCGQVYASMGHFDRAEQLFFIATEPNRGNVSAHFSLAKIYLALNRRVEAGEQLDRAIMAEKKAYLKEFLKAEKLIRLYPTNRNKLLDAQSHLEKSLEFQPRYYQALQRLAELGERLKEPGDNQIPGPNPLPENEE